MTRLFRGGIALIALACFAVPAQAWWCCCCPPPPCVTWVEKTVTCYKPTWQEREVTQTIMKPVHRTEMVKRSCTVMVPVWSERLESCLVPTFVPRQIEREVVCTRLVPVCISDPCTGCTYTTCKPETYTRRELYTVMDCVPVRKDITVKVCNFKPETKTFEVPHVRTEWQPQTVTYKERFCALVPVEMKVTVLECCP
jgi:hypothetical protein